MEDNSYKPPENAQAFDNWLANVWLAEYLYDKLAVFDFYNVLTSNDGDILVNDLGKVGGNHHRWWQDSVQHIQTLDNDLGLIQPPTAIPIKPATRRPRPSSFPC